MKMATEYYWSDEADAGGMSGILDVKLENLTTWPEYHIVIDRIIHEVETTTLERIDVIVSGDGRSPGGNPIPHMQRTYRDLAGKEKLGLLLLIGDNGNSLQAQLMRMVGQIVLKTAGIAMTQMRMVVSSRDEALQLIKDDRANINNSVWDAMRRR